jgi:hypothetical protein
VMTRLNSACENEMEREKQKCFNCFFSSVWERQSVLSFFFLSVSNRDDDWLVRGRDRERIIFLLSLSVCLFSHSAKMFRLPIFNRKGWNMIWALALVAKGQIAVQN